MITGYQKPNLETEDLGDISREQILSLLREEDWVTGTVKVWDARALVVEADRTRSGRSVPGDPGVGSEEEMP